MKLGGLKNPVKLTRFFLGPVFFSFTEVNGHDMKNFKISSLRRRATGQTFRWKSLAAQSLRAAFFSASKKSPWEL